MTPTRTLNPDSLPLSGTLPARLMLWLDDNPDEELYTKDIAIKFDVDANGIATTLRRCVDLGWLRRTGTGKSGVGGGYSYGITDDGRAAAQRMRIVHASSDPAVKVRKMLPDLDVDSIRVEYDVEIRPYNATKGSTRYDQLLDKLDRPGASLAVPYSYYGTLQKACIVYGKRHGRTLRIVRETVDTARIKRGDDVPASGNANS